MPHSFIPEILSAIHNIKKKFKIVVMPDFFIDHFVILDMDIDTFLKAFKEIALQGGGNLIGTTQMLQRGGNSANVAAALYKLGANVKLIAKTSPMGMYFLKGFLGDNFDYSGIKTNGRLSSTVSIELKYKNGKSNVMISDSGSAADFKFTDLNDKDLEQIVKSDMVAVMCVNHNKYGAELARKVFQFARRYNVQTYIDVGDPSLVPNRITEVVKEVLEPGFADIFSVNENELIRFTSYFETQYRKFIGMEQGTHLYRQAAKTLSQHLPTRLDLHTKLFSASYFNGKELAIVPTFKLDAKIGCGAGDAWNAGNMFAQLLKFNDNKRLMFANAFGGLYVSMGNAEHPNIEMLSKFLKSNPEQYTL